MSAAQRGCAPLPALAACLAVAACAPAAPARGPGGERFRDPGRAAAERAADLVSRMTRDEKIAQLMTDAPAIPRLGVAAYDWWNEALHGVARAGTATVFPQAIGLAATFDEPLVRRVAQAVSDEARAKYNLAQARGERGRYQGLTFFSPNLNIFRDPRWGRGQETFGEDPTLTGAMGVAFIGGMQGDDPRWLKTVATAKHFAVHSGPEADRHAFDARATAHDLADTYLPQFEAAVRRGKVASVMAAYNRVNGQPCAANRWLLADTLRGAWGFDGYVVGDCGAIGDIFGGHHTAATREQAAADALRAGTDLDCGHDYRALREALARGLVAEADLDRALVRLFSARIRLGTFDPPETVPWARLGTETVDAPEHRRLARQAAVESIALLENRGVLPLGAGVRRLLVAGPTADDREVLLGDYHGTPASPVLPLAGIRAAARARGVSVRYVRGATLAGSGRSTAEVADAVAAARRSDLVIAVVGLDPRLEAEEGDSALNPAGDRSDLGLPGAQEKLIEALIGTGKPVVVVLTGGSALAVPFAAAHAAALLDVWYPGQDGGAALADVLFGDASPGGRLPVTFYRSGDDLPPFADYGMQGRTYRYPRPDRPPLYPFGYGLSYARIRYANLLVGAGATSVSVDVQNGGARAGDEVVQVYVIPKSPPAYAPRRWLAAFGRVTLAAGERRTVSLPIPPEGLTLVDQGGTRRPLTGEVEVAVGGGQPDAAGRYADDARGLSASVRLGD
ncbi:MAG TPA: glycoside hydrolase family 3 C-terminal domain-containing protein [Polyangia bacterium]|nr:glycoside hydrolase family 3 C-terminal domain-containing protein [Polyangia bacterium]